MAVVIFLLFMIMLMLAGFNFMGALALTCLIAFFALLYGVAKFNRMAERLEKRRLRL